MSDPKDAGREQARMGLMWPFITSQPTISGTPPPRPYLLILSKLYITWESNIQIYEPMGTILIQTITWSKNCTWAAGIETVFQSEAIFRGGGGEAQNEEGIFDYQE